MGCSAGILHSAFSILHSLGRQFRTMFQRDQRSEFVTRYGYRKQYVPVGTPQADATYGAVTDRVERGDRDTIRQLGEAPGVLPDFIVRSLLPCCIWMHKRDLDDGLPGYAEVRVEVEPEAEQMIPIRCQSGKNHKGTKATKRGKRQRFAGSVPDWYQM